MTYDVSETSSRETLEAGQIGLWTPESMSTAHLITKYERGIALKQLTPVTTLTKQMPPI